MNPRIKELAKQCYETGPIGKDGWPEYSKFNEEKFAELIVKECMSVAKGMRNPPNLNYNPSDRFIDELRLHFGFKEPQGWVCPKCGVDRIKASCPQGHTAALTGDCPMYGIAL